MERESVGLSGSEAGQWRNGNYTEPGYRFLQAAIRTSVGLFALYLLDRVCVHLRVHSSTK